jgi:hypothetical protein
MVIILGKSLHHLRFLVITSVRLILIVFSYYLFDLPSLHFQDILLPKFYTYSSIVSSSHIQISCEISLSWRYQVLCRLDL